MAVREFLTFKGHEIARYRLEKMSRLAMHRDFAEWLDSVKKYLSCLGEQRRIALLSRMLSTAAYRLYRTSTYKRGFALNWCKKPVQTHISATAELSKWRAGSLRSGPFTTGTAAYLDRWLAVL